VKRSKVVLHLFEAPRPWRLGADGHSFFDANGAFVGSAARSQDATAIVMLLNMQPSPAAPKPVRRCRKCGGFGRPDKPGGVCKYCGACSDIMPTEPATPAPRGERRRGK
jgi:hypothetical protein